MILEMKNDDFEIFLENLFQEEKYDDLIKIFELLLDSNDYQKFKIILSLNIKYDLPIDYINKILLILINNDNIYQKEPIAVMSINDFISKNHDKINYDLYIKYFKKLINSDNYIFIDYGFGLLNILINYKYELFQIHKDDIRHFLLFRYNDSLEYRIRSRILYDLCHYMPNKEIIDYIKKNLLERLDEENQKLFFESYSTLYKDKTINFQEYISIAKENKKYLEIYLFYILKDIEQYINANQSENNFVLYDVFQLFILNMDFFYDPMIRKYLSTLKFNTYWNEACPKTISLINDILKEKNYRKPHFGWYYNLYKQYEKELVNILYYIPLDESFDKENYKFGSPALVDIHVKIGTRIDSILNSYLEDYPDQIINDTKNGNFNDNIKSLQKYLPLNEITVILRDYNKSYQPFYFKDINPEWYRIYSKKKHYLLKMEDETNLSYVLESLAALYSLIVYHPENWNSIEYDWDSDIFDKYSIQPKIMEVT